MITAHQAAHTPFYPRKAKPKWNLIPLFDKDILEENDKKKKSGLFCAGKSGTFGNCVAEQGLLQACVARPDVATQNIRAWSIHKGRVASFT